MIQAPSLLLPQQPQDRGQIPGQVRCTPLCRADRIGESGAHAGLATPLAAPRGRAAYSMGRDSGVLDAAGVGAERVQAEGDRRGGLGPARFAPPSRRLTGDGHQVDASARPLGGLRRSCPGGANSSWAIMGRGPDPELVPWSWRWLQYRTGVLRDRCTPPVPIGTHHRRQPQPDRFFLRPRSPIVIFMNWPGKSGDRCRLDGRHGDDQGRGRGGRRRSARAGSPVVQVWHGTRRVCDTADPSSPRR
jgi:hypothetical protein